VSSHSSIMKTESALRFWRLFLFSKYFRIIWVPLYHTQLRTLVWLLWFLKDFTTFITIQLLHAWLLQYFLTGGSFNFRSSKTAVLRSIVVGLFLIIFILIVLIYRFILVARGSITIAINILVIDVSFRVGNTFAFLSCSRKYLLHLLSEPDL
jgi:hypothetical protein